METLLVVLTALALIGHLPAVAKFVKKTKTKWDDRALVVIDKAKDSLED
jgi:hypothetical protein